MNKKEFGFTLIEILLSIVILGIIIISFIYFFGSSARFIKEVDIREKALFIAQQKIEGIKALDWSVLPDNTTETEIYNKTQYPELGLKGYPEYELKVHYNLMEKGNYDIKEITITVSWNDKKQISLKTLYSQRE